MYEMVGNRCPVTKKKNQMLSMTSICWLTKTSKKYLLIFLPMIKKLATNTAAILVKLILKETNLKTKLKSIQITQVLRRHSQTLRVL